MIRTKGEAGTGNVVSAVQHSRIVTAEIEHLRESDNLESIIDVIMEGYRRIKSAYESWICTQNDSFWIYG